MDQKTVVKRSVSPLTWLPTGVSVAAAIISLFLVLISHESRFPEILLGGSVAAIILNVVYRFVLVGFGTQTVILEESLEESRAENMMLQGESADLNVLMEEVSVYFGELFRRIPAPCFCFDSHGRFQEWNTVFEHLVVGNPSLLLDTPLYDYIRSDEGVEKIKAIVDSVFEGQYFEGVELQVPGADGALTTLLCNVFPLRGEGGKVTAAICAGIDISERIRLEQRLRSHVDKLNETQIALEAKQIELMDANTQLELLAMCDSLTGLKNHRALQERLRSEFKRSMRYGTTVSVLMVDVDRFKKYNDSYGHLAGDEVLKEVGRILGTSVRDTDFVGRYGGEEFVILMPHTDYLSSLEAAERLRGAVEAAAWEQIRVTVSIGVSTFHNKMAQYSDLVAEADLALYHSKQHGRNQVNHANDIPDKDELRATVSTSITPSSDTLSSFLL